MHHILHNKTYKSRSNSSTKNWLIYASASVCDLHLWTLTFLLNTHCITVDSVAASYRPIRQHGPRLRHILYAGRHTAVLMRGHGGRWDQQHVVVDNACLYGEDTWRTASTYATVQRSIAESRTRFKPSLWLWWTWNMLASQTWYVAGLGSLWLWWNMNILTLQTWYWVGHGSLWLWWNVNMVTLQAWYWVGHGSLWLWWTVNMVTLQAWFWVGLWSLWLWWTWPAVAREACEKQRHRLGRGYWVRHGSLWLWWNVNMVTLQTWFWVGLGSLWLWWTVNMETLHAWFWVGLGSLWL